MRLNFRFISDDADPEALPAAFAAYWPAYQKWIRRSPTTDAHFCTRQLRNHMPELVPVFERLLDRFGGGDDVARFLTLYDPPRVVRACTQLALNADRPILIRSYDHHPRLFDAIVLGSNWSGNATLAMTDCLWGALDGVNERGCAVSLAFGGRSATGAGFAAPIVLRYVLETCATVQEVRATLDRVPVSMPYTFVAIDSTGDFVTAYLGPDRPAKFVARRASANHQGRVEWHAYASQTQSVERLACAESLLTHPCSTRAVRDAFLAPPLWRDDYARGGGTLYVVEYEPAAGTMVMRWPGGRAERLALNDAQGREFAAAPGRRDA